ncbi:MAG: hypothetical protein P4L03_01950 [Terracidiphilus sp.]|nr:hypothetical protein [Terracidiphilus sp.]
MPETPTQELNLNLLNNGIDFIQSGVRFFLHDEPDPISHKYAILHLFSGILLLLKERLRREHPSLIFVDVKEVGSPDGKTVDFDELISRLRNCAGVEVDEKAQKTLRSARRLRNLIEHYEPTISVQHAQAIIGNLSEFAYLFMQDELNVHLEEHIESEVWERMQVLRRISVRLAEEEAADWRRRAEQYSVLDDEQLEALADIKPYHPRHNPDPDTFLNCPECGEETLIQTKDKDIGICTNKECRKVSEITFCFRCGERLTDGSNLCGGCEDYIDNQ